MFGVYIKSGVSGYCDYDGCDLRVAEIPSNNVPNKGEVLSIEDDKYIVMEVERVYWNVKDGFNEMISVYVAEFAG